MIYREVHVPPQENWLYHLILQTQSISLHFHCCHFNPSNHHFPPELSNGLIPWFSSRYGTSPLQLHPGHWKCMFVWGRGVAFSFVTVNWRRALSWHPTNRGWGCYELNHAAHTMICPSQHASYSSITGPLSLPALSTLQPERFFFFFKTQIRWCLSYLQSCPLTLRTNKNQNLKSGLQGAASPPVSVQVSLLSSPHSCASDSHLSSK